MGVKGLLSYVKDNGGRLTVPHFLHSCDLIIDGNNLLHFLYHRTNIDFRFGGEFDLYAAAVRRFFLHLRQCGVTAHVLFDGCYSPDGAKFPTTLQRARDRLHTCVRLNKGAHCGRLLPPMTPQVLVAVLDELGVFHLTCPDEADLNIAALAAQLSCPVLSNDSDFYVFDLPGGVISLDSLDAGPTLRACECCGEHLGLDCAIFRVERLAAWGVEARFLPLLATLLGNDFASRKALAQCFAKMQLPKPSRRASKCHAKTDSMLQWLRRFESPDAVVAAVESRATADHRAAVRSSIELSLDQYRLEKAWIHARQPPDFLEGREKAWEAMQKHRLSPALVNAKACGYVFLLAGPEALRLPSCHAGARPLRERVYAELGCSHDKALVEYGRREGNMCREKVPADALMPGERFPTFIAALDRLGRRGGSQQEVVLTAGDALGPLLLVMAFWTDNCGVGSVHVTALLLSVVCRMDAVRSLPEALLEEEEETEAALRQHREAVVAKYLNSPAVNNAKPLDLGAGHTFLAFQACLFAFSQLAWSGAVEDPQDAQPLLPVHNFLVGRFFYNLHADLKRRSHASLFVQEMLGRKSRLNDWFWKSRDFLLGTSKAQ